MSGEREDMRKIENLSCGKCNGKCPAAQYKNEYCFCNYCTVIIEEEEEEEEETFRRLGDIK